MLEDLGLVNNYLGIKKRKKIRGRFTLKQKAKIEEIAKKFNLEESKPTVHLWNQYIYC